MGMRILIADDSAMMRKMITKVVCNRGGHTVVGEAKNGLEALALYKELKPDLITMDIIMGGMDGLTAAREILSYDGDAHILFLSNLDKAKYHDDIENIGTVGFVNKHGRCPTLLDKLKEISGVSIAHPTPLPEVTQKAKIGMRILIVDDSAMMRKMITKVLCDRGGHTVVGEAKNGLEALALYKELKPDLVTMDITMGGMDGLTAAREILLYDSDAHILFLSNLDKEKYNDDIESIGAIGFVNKHRSQDILDIINS